MIFLWYAILLISTSWLYITKIFFYTNWPFFLLFLTAGAFFAWIGIWQLFKCDSARNKKFLFSIGNTFFLLTLLLLLQFLFIHIYFWIAPHIHRIEVFSQILSPLVNMFGLDTTAQNGIIYVQTYRKIVPFIVTLEKLSFFVFSNFYLGSIILLIFMKDINVIKYLLRLTIIIFVYALLRLISLIFIYIDFEILSIFWNPMFILITLIPLPIILTYFCPSKRFEAVNFDFSSLSRDWLIFSALEFMAVFFLVALICYEDPGIIKRGRILIDDYHSSWEWTTIKFDKSNYGEQSTYNYYSLMNWLNHYYYYDVNIDQEITPSLLENYDIFILKTPTNPFLVQEKDAILNFVEKGGGLFLIGDHNNLFGTTTHINPIADAFKIRFMADDTFDLTSGQPSFFKPYKLVCHPVVQHIEEFEFETSCTIQAPFLSEHVMIGYALGREMVDYSHVNFFGNMQTDIDEEFGLFIQAAAIKYGKGRVLAFSDATVFSNFSMFYEGKPELALGSIDYLNRKNSSNYIKYLFCIISFICFLGLFFLLKKINPRLIVISIVVFSSLAFLFSTIIIRYLNLKNYPLPKPHTKYWAVSFNRDYSCFRLPPMLEYQSPDPENCFDTFYVNTQRINLYPSLEKSLASSFKKGNITVIVNPSKDVSKKDLSTFYNYIFNGGRVLFLDSHNNTDSSINKFLKEAGMKVERINLEGSDIQPQEQEIIPNNLTISGGNIVKINLNFSAENDILISEKKLGKGKVVVLLGSEWLSRRHMGRVFLKPNSKQLEFYNLEYFLFEEVVIKD